MLNSQYLQLLQQQLAQLATQANFETIMTTAFGTNINHGQIHNLRQQWLNGNFSLIPPIETLSHGELGNANGGYAASLDRIFVSSEFLAAHSKDPTAIANLLLEEFGHKLDRLLNGNVDSLGDEGDIFRRLVTGQDLSGQTLAILRSEDDHAIITVNGQSLVVEEQYFPGTAGNDNLYGGTGNDYLDGGAGNDSLYGGTGGDDILFGRTGDDYLYGGTGNDKLSGGTGNDKLSGNDGNDTLYGEDGNDYLNGNDGNDSLDGGTGNDYLYGGAGNDDLYGGAGNDYLFGDAGNDSLDGGTGNDYLFGGDGDDKLFGDAGDDSLSGDAGDDSLSGGAGDDSLSGGTGNDILYGYTGNDILYGGNGNNYLYGDAGNDTLIGDTGNDYLAGGSGNDTYIIYGIGDIVYEDFFAGVDKVDSYVSFTLGVGVENLTLLGTDDLNGTGNYSNNIILGNNGNNFISGDTGDDLLNGGTGNDSLAGGNGNDTYVIDADVDLGTDTITENLTGGVDTLDFRTTTTKAVNVNLSSTTPQTVATGVQLVIPVVSLENVYGGSLNDILTGNSLNNTLLGGDGNDILNGVAGNDSLNGGAGIDSLNGGAGIDTLTGGTGNDRFLFSGVALTGANTVATSLGRDNIADFKKAELDKIVLSKATFTAITALAGGSLGTQFASVASDALAATSSAVITYSVATGNLFYNQNGAAAGFGTNGGNFAAVSTGLPALAVSDFTIANDLQLVMPVLNIDNLYTGTGNDTLTGNDLNNTLDGGAGNDKLTGGRGDDFLIGGAGSDRFIFGANIAIDTVSIALLGKDTIADFMPLQDTISLNKTSFSAIASPVGTLSDFEFATVTDDTLAGASSAKIVYGVSSGNLFYNQNGTAAGLGTNGCNFAVLTGIPPLSASDFTMFAPKPLDWGG